MIRRVGAAGAAVAVAAGDGVVEAGGVGVEVGDGGVGDGVIVGSIVAVEVGGEVGTLDGPSPASGSSGVDSMIG